MINKNIKLPLYYQLAELIIGQIESEEYAPSDMIPSERELMFSHGISRATVRQAIDYLVNKKYLIKKHGKGTFVSNSYYRQKLFEFYSFTNEMKKKGKTPKSLILSFDEIHSDTRVSAKMHFQLKTPVYRLVRIRLADEIPMMYETTYLNKYCLPDLTEDLLKTKPLYDVIKEDYKIVFTGAKEKFKAVIPPRHILTKLELDDFSPCLRIQRITYIGRGIIEYTESFAVGEKTEFEVNLN